MLGDNQEDSFSLRCADMMVLFYREMFLKWLPPKLNYNTIYLMFVWVFLSDQPFTPSPIISSYSIHFEYNLLQIFPELVLSLIRDTGYG